MDEPLTHEQFAPHVGKAFGIEGCHMTLRLTSVERQSQFAVPNAPRVPFTLIFEGPVGDILPAGFYRATIADGPVFELNIMPIHTHARDHQDYQAVFN